MSTPLPAPAPPRSTVPRRTMLTGLAGSSLALLGLSACSEDAEEPSTGQTPVTDAGPQEPDEEQSQSLAVVYREDARARGDWTVWSVGYDLGEDEEAPALYDPSTQQARHEALEEKKAEKQWTAQDPLLVLDPYGSTRTGLYVYFEDEATGSLDVLAEAASTEDFSGVAANHAASGGFEGLVIGLIPGAHTDLTLTWRPEGGEESAGTLRYKAPTTVSGYATTIAADIRDPDALTPGLFAMNAVTSLSNNTYVFDNSGTMRAEILAEGTAAHGFIPVDGRIVTTTGASQVGVLDPFGHATTLIDLAEHSVHHDLTVVDDIAYVLTSASGSGRVEDRVLRVDLASGAVDQVVDLQQLLPEYEAIAHAQEGRGGGSMVDGKDWIHINSIDITDGVMILSARETSTIIALDDALELGGTPSVRWMIGVEELWEGTGYEDLFLAPEGDVLGNAGQHTVHRIDDDALPEGQYYLEMFNNNYWRMSTREEDEWLDVGPANATTHEHDGVSHVLRYRVDENAGTFSQDEAIELPYSSVVSNVYRLGDGGLDQNMVANSGRSNVFSERTADGEVVASYRYDSASHGYRVYKDPFEGFWFAAE